MWADSLSGIIWDRRLVVESGQKWFAECLSSRGGSYPADIGSVDVGWLPVRHHLGSEVGGSKWLKVVGSGQKWFAECLSSRGSSYPAEIRSVGVGWFLVQDHPG